MNKQIWLGLAISVVMSSGVFSPALAMSGPSWININGGPLGPLEVSAGFDGYFFAQTGAGNAPHESVVGDKAVGAKINAFMVQMRKATGLVQFTFQLAEYTDINLGANGPKEINGNEYPTGPIRAAYITLAPTHNFSISIGQLDSLEGYESAFAWSNPVQLRTVIAAVENSESRGISASYRKGSLSGYVMLSDGFDTGVFDHLQFLAKDKLNANNNINIFGEFALGVTGPNTFAYGSGGLSSGGANGIGGQGQLANVNANLLGAWYGWSHGELTITPEVQYQYAKPIHRYANMYSGNLSDNIPKETSNLAAAIFTDYKFGTSPYSLGAWAEYATSHGSAAQDAWFVAPNARLVGFAVAPTWQHKYLFSRFNIGFVHLLNNGSPPAGYGSLGRDKNQIVATLEAGLVF